MAHLRSPRAAAFVFALALYVPLTTSAQTVHCDALRTSDNSHPSTTNAR